jgi:hypothetical protein
MLTSELLENTAPLTSWVKNLPEQQYHARPEVSCHKLLDFEKSPKQYFLKHVKKAEKKVSSAMEFGSLVHEAILEPIKFSDRAISPPVARNTVKWRHWNAENPHGIHYKDHEAIKSMQASYYAHPAVHDLLYSGHKEIWPEVSGFFSIQDLPMRMRCDILSPNFIVDVKTTSDASDKAFGFDADKYGYLFQATLYTKAAELIDGRKRDFYIIAIEKMPPYEVAVYQIPDAVFEKELIRIEKLISKIKYALVSDTWSYRSTEIKPIWLTNYYFERMYENQ